MRLRRRVSDARGKPCALALALTLWPFGCQRADPPGRIADVDVELGLRRPTVSAAGVTAAAPLPLDVPDVALEPGHGAKIASIAMRTWIYDSASDRSSKLGYLRAGAVVDRAERAAGNVGCEGGWYQVEPRGYVCAGKGASLSLDHPIVLAAPKGPRRDDPLPYGYAVSASPAPHLYFKLPTQADQARVEGSTYRTHVALSKVRFKDLPSDPIPQLLLDGKPLPQPYGTVKDLAYSVHRGRANDHSAFGMMASFDWTDRRFGLTTELDLIALDRTKPPKNTAVAGVEIREGGRPAFVVRSGTSRYEKAGDKFDEKGSVPGRTGVELTGASHGGSMGLLETTDGSWLPAMGLVVAELRMDRANHAARGRKWISVSIEKQILVAYEGERPVYGALVSTGRGGMSDPEKSFATIRGTFLIRAKHVSGTMDGDQASDEAFDLRDVPYIQYFHEGYALHAAYWHDDFGKVRSHGCVNLAPIDAKWIFDWTDPEVPAEWHGAVSPQGGTLVYIHR